MVKISANLKNLIKNGQKPVVKIKCGNLIFGYDDETNPQNPVNYHDVMELSVTRMAANGDYPLGNAYACCVDVCLWDVPQTSKLKGLKTEVYIGYQKDGFIDWVPMGVYYPEKPTRSGQLLSFTAFDKMYSLSYPYVASISGSHIPYAILQDLAKFGGFELDESVREIASGNFGAIPVSLLYGEETDENGISKVTSYDVNDCIGYVAGFLGANAHFNREGKLQLFRFNEAVNEDGTPYTISDDDVQSVSVAEDDHIISYICCNNGKEELCSPADATTINATGLKFSNPLITTNKQLNRIFEMISDDGEPFKYRSLALRNMSANPAVECFDIIRYVDEDGNNYRFPVMSTKYNYDGSLICDMQADAKSEGEGNISGSILNRVLAPLVQSATKPLVQRIEKATDVITGNAGGYVALVDTDGDNVPDNFIAGEYPVDLSAGSNWRTKGNCIRINKNGMGVSTTGADGPFADFAVYFDEKENKYFMNASDIAVGILRGIEIIADKGKIGGWTIDERSMYSDYTDTKGNTYRAYIQSASAAGSDSWVFSVQKKNSDGSFSGGFIVKADGSVSAYNGLTVEGNLKMDKYLSDGNGHTVIGINNNLVLGYGNYNLGLPTYVMGGDVYLRGNSNGSIFVQQAGNTRFEFGRTNWTFSGIDNSETARNTITSPSSMVLNANGGENALYLVGSTIHLLSNTNVNGTLKLGRQTWNIGGSTANRDNVLSSGGLVVSANQGNNALYLQGSSIYLVNGGLEYTGAIGINASGKIVHIDSSALRFKENIKSELDESLNPKKLYELPIKQFNFKDEYKEDVIKGDTQIGFIADEVAEIYPNAALYDRDGQVSGWNAHIMIPAILKLIQDQKKQIDVQQKQINNLSERLRLLEKYINNKSAD